MDHGYFKDRISAYHDRNLRPEETAVIEEHLKECAECRQLLDDFKKFDALVEKHSGLDGDDYWDESARRIESRLDSETATAITEISRSRGWSLAWKLAAVAASVTVLTVVGLHRNEIWKDTETVKEKIVAPAAIPQVDSLDYDQSKDEMRNLDSASDVTQLGKAEGTQADTNEIHRVRQPSNMTAPSVSPKVTDKVMPAPPESSPLTSKEVSAGTKKTVKTDLKESPVMTPKQETGVVMKSATPGTTDVTPQKNEEVMSDFEAGPSLESEITEAGIELTQLRRQKDSLLSLTGKDKIWDTSELTSTLAEKKTRTSLVPQPKPSPTEIENELIQVCFKVGMLTENEKELAEVRGVIEKVAKDENSPNRKLAESYLKQLDDR
ncbi:MAG: anti-sigma factor family protein [Candidatus Zixiibacteriota bacterium]